jgi:hypothetical protein
MLQPGDALLNFLTHLTYYGGYVGKGGVFIQLCGWLGTHELWTGAMSDTYYLSNIGILEEQEQSVKDDKLSDVPSTNIADKGYGYSLAAWQKGQLVMQPTFARTYGSVQIISSHQQQ